MGPKRGSDLGRLGENIIAQLFGFVRQKASGAIWPDKEDLISVERRELAQVKTTRNQEAVKVWLELEGHAIAETCKPRLFDVVITDGGQTALIFERVFHRSVDLGIGGDL